VIHLNKISTTHQTFYGNFRIDLEIVELVRQVNAWVTYN
jgi:hypothetical protein